MISLFNWFSFFAFVSYVETWALCQAHYIREHILHTFPGGFVLITNMLYVQFMKLNSVQEITYLNIITYTPSAPCSAMKT